MTFYCPLFHTPVAQCSPTGCPRHHVYQYTITSTTENWLPFHVQFPLPSHPLPFLSLTVFSHGRRPALTTVAMLNRRPFSAAHRFPHRASPERHSNFFFSRLTFFFSPRPLQRPSRPRVCWLVPVCSGVDIVDLYWSWSFFCVE